MMPIEISDHFEAFTANFASMRQFLICCSVMPHEMFKHIALISKRFAAKFARDFDVRTFVMEVVMNAKLNGYFFEFVIGNRSIGS